MKQVVLITLFALSFLQAKEHKDLSRFSFHVGPNLYYFHNSATITNDFIKEIYENESQVLKEDFQKKEHGITTAIEYGVTFWSPLIITLQGSFATSDEHTEEGVSPVDTGSSDTLYVKEEVVEDKSNMFINGEATVGHCFKLSETFSATPLLGLRISSWIRPEGFVEVLNSGQTDTISYFERRNTYTRLQGLAGIRLHKKLSKKMSLQFQGSVDLQLKGTMDYIDEDSELLDSATTVTLGNRMGTTLSLGITRHFKETIALQISPHYHYYQWGQSSKGTKYYWDGLLEYPYGEPESSTHLFGLMVKMILQPRKRKG